MEREGGEEGGRNKWGERRTTPEERRRLILVTNLTLDSLTLTASSSLATPSLVSLPVPPTQQVRQPSLDASASLDGPRGFPGGGRHAMEAG